MLSLGRFIWNVFQDTQNSLNFTCLSDSNFCLHGFCFLVIFPTLFLLKYIANDIRKQIFSLNHKKIKAI